MAEQVVELDPGESKLVSFEAVPKEARTYQVIVNGLTGSFIAKPVPPKWFYVEAKGRYVSIHMKGPGAASEGDKFNIYVAMLNWDFAKQKPYIDLTLGGQPVMHFNKHIVEGSYDWMAPLPPKYYSTEYDLWPKDGSWKFSVTMPARPLNIRADGWIEEEEYAHIPWHIDATVSCQIPLIG